MPISRLPTHTPVHILVPIFMHPFKFDSPHYPFDLSFSYRNTPGSTFATCLVGWVHLWVFIPGVDSFILRLDLHCAKQACVFQKWRLRRQEIAEMLNMNASGRLWVVRQPLFSLMRIHAFCDQKLVHITRLTKYGKYWIILLKRDLSKHLDCPLLDLPWMRYPTRFLMFMQQVLALIHIFNVCHCSQSTKNQFVSLMRLKTLTRQNAITKSRWVSIFRLHIVLLDSNFVSQSCRQYLWTIQYCAWNFARIARHPQV
jgi:hypothetical protein